MISHPTSPQWYRATPPELPTTPLAQEMMLAEARQIVRHAKMCSDYAARRGQFAEPKTWWGSMLDFLAPTQLRLMHHLMYSCPPDPSEVENAELYIALYANETKGEQDAVWNQA